jgi:hypothetical protein
MAKERRRGGRRTTDKRPATDQSATLTNEQRTGVVQHDDRGDARWVFPSEQQAQEVLDRTFDELKALDNAALALQSDPTPSKAPPGGGYNPYDVSTPAPKKRADKGRR